MRRVDSLEKALILVGIGGRQRRGWQRMRWWKKADSCLTRWTWVWVNSRSWWWTGKSGVLRFMGLQRVGYDWATELNWCQSPSLSVTVRLFETPWTVAYQASFSMRFPRQEYWSGLSFPSPGDLLDWGIKPGLLHCRQFLYCLSHQGGQTSKAEMSVTLSESVSEHRDEKGGL